MKALITAGGHGTRLRPITHTKNKHLIPIANRPMLAYALEYAHKAGIEEVGIVVNEGDKEISATFGDGNDLNVNITYIEQKAPLGLAHVVKIAESYIDGDEFIFYLGDNILVGGIKKFIDEFHENRSSCHLVLSKVPDPERFGVPEIKVNQIVAVEEKPTSPKSNYAVTGIYLYDQNIFEAVNSIIPSVRGELEISDAHQYLLDKGLSVTYSEITGWWKDTGKSADLLEANRLVLDNVDGPSSAEIDNQSKMTGRVVSGTGTKIVRSTIRGPVILGQDVIVKNAYIGPYTSIGDRCSIIGSEVEYSIFMSDSLIENVGVRIEASLVGHEVKITNSSTRPKTHRLMVGNQGKIELA